MTTNCIICMAIPASDGGVLNSRKMFNFGGKQDKNLEQSLKT